MGHCATGRTAFWMLVLVVLGSWCAMTDAFFGWMRKGTESPPPPPPSPVPDGYTPPFEMTVADDKFLAEARKMELTPLDSCHYRVVAQLKSTCSSLSEEQLAKLGVVLFNCQAEVEGRQTYPCTEEMSLKECTADMDPDTWNAYHIVSNRARSVCYATRQQHFRRKAELTVNALISTATGQLEAMQDLKEGQLQLKEQTVASLEKLMQGHSALHDQQGALQQGQDELETSISSNLQRLGQEKALIASGQELVAQLIQGITLRMENVTEQLKGQGSDLQDGHKAILDDLAEVRGRAQDIYSKIEHNLSGFLRYQNRTARYYSDLMGKLERMNGTLGYMLLYLDNMQTRLEDRLHLIQRYLGQAGLSLTALWTCAVHAGYFLLAALLLSFLHFPCFPRAALLVTVPLNALAELNQQPSLGLPELSLLLISLSLGHWFLQQVAWGCSRLRGKGTGFAPLPPAEAPVSCPRGPHHPCLRSSTPERDLGDGIGAADLLAQDSFAFDGPRVATPRRAALMEDLPFLPPALGTASHSTPRLKGGLGFSGGGLGALEGIPQRHLGLALDGVSDCCSTSQNQSVSSNSSASGRQFCNGTTKAGLPCKKRALLGQDYCRIHEGGYTSYNPM
ncbi:protein brambleberry [Conger conger]|uniref:protein brambleberry n=1 Tax=Conger conger TaxID=82655 RepID=UPI002A598BAD|nr:protein brambleberry [Conger conger]